MRWLLWLPLLALPLACSSGGDSGAVGCEEADQCAGRHCLCKDGNDASARVCVNHACLDPAETCAFVCGEGQVAASFPVQDDLACPKELAGTIGSPGSHEVVASGGVYVLEADDTHLYFTQDFELRRLPLSGGTSEVVSSTSLHFGPVLEGDSVYGASGDMIDPDIVAIPKQGGDAVVLAKSDGQVMGMTVLGGAVYWTTFYGLFKVGVSGGSPEQVLKGIEFGPLTHDAEALYYDHGTFVFRLPLGGTPTAIAAAQSAGDLAMAGDVLVASDWGWNNIAKIAKDGSGTTVLACKLEFPEALAIDGARVYWVNASAGSVAFAELAGGPGHTLAEGSDLPLDITVGGGFVWWTVQGETGTNEIRRVPIPG